MMAAKPADTALSIFGACAQDYDWYAAVKSDFEHGDDFDAPDDWSYTVTMYNDADAPSMSDVTTVRINHTVIMRTARKIVNRGYDTLPDYARPSNACREACKALIFDVDSADFDADTADQVLQLAVLGEVRYS